MVKAGVDEAVIMKLTGHKTLAMFLEQRLTCVWCSSFLLA
jgi:hypothetical protein